MTAICAQAKLTERYFYESFTSRDELLQQVLDRIADEIRDAGLSALRTSTGTLEQRVRNAITAFVTILTDDCPVAVAAAVMAYFDRENAGQCGSCFNGTAAMSAITSALRDGAATAADLGRLERWSVVLRGRGACATLDAATNIAASLLRQYPELVARHLDGECDPCSAGAFSAVRPYEVEAS
jgi:AcrR family transcriptional regulator